MEVHEKKYLKQVSFSLRTLDVEDCGLSIEDFMFLAKCVNIFRTIRVVVGVVGRLP